jgi:benzaldehyde dehydrogenase (NAD)
VVDTRTVECVVGLIEDALAKGATQLTGGETTGNVLMPAHVIDNVTPEMRLFRDESFGPVVAIVRARDEAHAIELANDTEYGLSASVFTRDIANGLKVARRIQSGICHVNGPTVHDEAQMPFGGMKASGYGRFGGKAGIDAFTELRWITVETEPGHYPI